MISFQGICLRHSKYCRHSLNDCSARRLYNRWIVFCFNHSIWSCVRAGMTPVDMLKFIINAGKSCKRGLVYKWHARFFEWTRKHCIQWPRRTTKNKKKFGIGEALNEDRKKTIDELADHFDVSYTELFIIL